MPSIFRHRGYNFFFYSNEGTPREPVHIHVEKNGMEAKFWLRSEVRVAYNDGYDAAHFGSYWRSSRLTTTGSRGHGMNSSVSATRVHFDQDSMWVDLSDGRIIGVPLAWFPRLLHASTEQREQVRISSRGLHWEALDEDISIAGLLAGQADQTTHKTFAA
jgi:hypothetical protein